MGKLARLASVKSANKESFVYLPPDSGYKATRILLNCDVSIVSLHVLGKVLRGLRRASPMARILLVDRVCPAENVEGYFAQYGVSDLLDDNMRVASVDELIMMAYKNQLNEPITRQSVEAPGYIAEYDCAVSLTALFQEGETAFATLHNIRRILPCDAETDIPPEDLYFTIGHRFHGAVLELPDKVIWGDDWLAVDEAVSREFSNVAIYVKAILQMK